MGTVTMYVTMGTVSIDPMLLHYEWYIWYIQGMGSKAIPFRLSCIKHMSIYGIFIRMHISLIVFDASATLNPHLNVNCSHIFICTHFVYLPTPSCHRGSAQLYVKLPYISLMWLTTNKYVYWQRHIEILL